MGNTVESTGKADGGQNAIIPVADTSLYKDLSKGITEFEYVFKLLRPGILHVTIYDIEGKDPNDNAYAGIYLGEILDPNAGASSEGATENPDRGKLQSSKTDVLASVNDVAITIAQVNSVAGKRENEIRQKFTGAEREKQLAEARKHALDDLINRELLLQEFRSRGYSISEKIIDDHIQGVIETQFSGNRGAFLSQLEEHGYTLETFREIERDKMCVQVMFQSILKDTQNVQQRGQKLNEWFASARQQASISIY